MTEREAGGHLDLVAVSAALDDDAFAELYADHHDGVRRTLSCLGVPEGALDDAVQEVFVVVHRRLGDPQRFTTLKGWIYGVARRIAWRHHRTAGRGQRRLALVEADVPTSLPPDELLAQREASEFIHAFLAGLDESQREVFVLAEIENVPIPEIATIVGAKLNTVYSRLRLVRARFEGAVVRRQTRIRREAGHGN